MLIENLLLEWVSWVRALRFEELFLILAVVLLVDAPRYAYSAVVMAVFDLFRNGFRRCLPGPHAENYDYLPSVCVIIAGYNEADTIAETMESVWNRYPNLQLVVVDDGSTDGMTEAAAEFAAGRSGITVVRRERRGGKSSALNAGLHYATAEVVVSIDADSRLDESSIYELIQPLKDPRVAGVSATVLAWNPFASLASWLQAYEYRQTIFISRMSRGRTGQLGIVSGAFGAFRTTVLKQLGGWDVGPGEDGDLILRLRKAGYKIGVAPYAHCYTNVPVSWIRLFWQRCRWDRTVITFECRKHGDMGVPWSKNFRWSNMLLMAERWFFNVVCVYTFWIYGIWLLATYLSNCFHLLILLYLCGLFIEALQMLVLLYYSDRLKHDLLLSLVLPLYPLYQIYMKAVDIFALSAEILFRHSGQDNFVPLHVRTTTWRW